MEILILHIFLFLISIIIPTLAYDVRLISFTVGSVTTYLQTNHNPIGPQAILQTYINTTTSSIYAVQVDADASICQVAICRNAITVPIVVGPRGCDSRIFEDAVESSNCAETDEQASHNADIVRSTWYFTYGTSECIAAGGTIKSCFGPVYVIRQQASAPLPSISLITDAMLLNSQGVVVITGIGPRGDVPGVTWVDVEYPHLEVQTTNCSDTLAVSYEGAYEPSYTDGVSSVLVNETRIYKRLIQATYQRVAVKRPGERNDTKLVLGRINDDSITVDHESTVAITEDWIDSLPTTFTFTTGCVATISVVSLNGDLPLKTQYQLTETNYDKNKWNGRFHQTSACNVMWGRYAFDLTLVFPGTADALMGGGMVDFTTGGVVSKNIKVIADKTFDDYELRCDRFWGRQTSFPAYGTDYDPVTGLTNGETVQPEDKENFLCNAPFPNPLAIHEQDGYFGVRYQQCFKMGGYVTGRALQYCSRPLSYQPCKKGWVFFDEYCYYKFNPIKDSQFKSSSAQGDDSCRLLFDKARSLKQLDADLKSWIMTNFIFMDRIEAGHPYRTNFAGRRCLAFDYIEGIDLDSDVVRVDDVSCEDIMFPFCRYHHKDYVVPHSEERWHPMNILVMRDGQDGVPHQGFSLGCKCRNGYTAPECSTLTCGLATVIESSELTQWFLKCYLHGSCDNGRPRLCACHEGFGPDADQTVEGLKDQNPCACPAAPIFEPYVSTKYNINGTIYSVTLSHQVVCGGISNGGCVIQGDLNQGTCVCVVRTNLNPDSKIKEQPAFDDIYCLARVPFVTPNQIQYNGDIVERFCNAIGIACPSGQRFDEQRLDEVRGDMFGRKECRESNGDLKTGCVCPSTSGRTGMSCTCPSPRNVLQSVLYRIRDVTSLVYSVYGLFNKRESVTRVQIERFQCPVITNVQTQDGEDTPLNCTQIFDSWEWDCHYNYGTRIILTSDYDPIQCDAKAFNIWHPPCGNNTNPTAGRFIANEFYRNFELHMYPQPSDFAAYGCTDTECMCDPDHSAKLCNAGISSYRFDWDLNAIHREVCGENTIPPRGHYDPDTGLCVCHVGQRPFESIFTHKACESEAVKDKDTGEYVECNGRGMTIPAQFPYGRCEYDLNDQGRDPLQSLFISFSPEAENTSSVFTVINNDTIVRLYDGIEYKYWRFFFGQQLRIDGLQPIRNTTIVENHNMVPFPQNFSYVCEGSTGVIAAPQRMEATVTVWEVVFICDNPEVDLGDLSCYTTEEATYDETVLTTLDKCLDSWTSEIDYVNIGVDYLTYKCIKAVEWTQAMVHVNERLESGTYLQSTFLTFKLDGDTRTTDSLAYGKFDCSDPLDRVMADVAVQRGLVNKRQCGTDSTFITSHSNVLGHFYGLFYRSLPGMTPFDQEWTEEHYRYIGSLLEDEICENDVTGQIEERAFDGTTADEIALRLLDSIGSELITNFNLSDTRPIETTMVRRENSQGLEFIGLYGNPYIHLLSNDTYTFGEGGRPAWSMVLPTGTDSVRKFSLHFPFNGTEAIQVYGPLGALCTTMYGPFAAGDIIDVDGCGDALFEHEERYISLLRLVNHTEMLAGFNSTEPYHRITVVWWMTDEVTDTRHHGTDYTEERVLPFFRYGDISYTGRREGYVGLFASIKSSVYIHHLWPPTGVYGENCLERKTGRSLRTLNYNSETDKAYLKRLWNTHLAPRLCTHDWQCKLFARDQNAYECKYDTEFREGWLGGDGSSGLVGIEGGCLCTQGFDYHPCYYCNPGYGPNSPLERELYLAFYPDNDSPEFCTLPYLRSSTRTGACGGRGTLEFDVVELDNITLNVFEDNKTRRCGSIIFNGNQTLELNQEVDYTLEVMAYGQSLVVIDEHVYYQHEELVLESREGDVLTFEDGSTIECREWLYHATHAVKWPGHRLMNSLDNFWLTKVVDLSLFS